MPSKVDIWMPLSIGDYLADTSHLTTIDHGAYLLLLMHYWRKGPLPNDLSRIASICKLPSDAWSIAQALLAEFFHLEEDGFYHQGRADREMEKWQGKRMKAQEKAKIAAAARWPKDAPSIPPSNAQSTPQAMLGTCPLPLPLPAPLPIPLPGASAELDVVAQTAKRPRSSPAAIPSPGVFDLPLADKTIFEVPEGLYRECVSAYPGVSVMAELAKMRIWLVTHPEKGKTRRGMPAAINSWLSRAQNLNGGRNGSSRPTESVLDRIERERAEAAANRERGGDAPPGPGEGPQPADGEALGPVAKKLLF